MGKADSHSGVKCISNFTAIKRWQRPATILKSFYFQKFAKTGKRRIDPIDVGAQLRFTERTSNTHSCASRANYSSQEAPARATKGKSTAGVDLLRKCPNWSDWTSSVVEVSRFLFQSQIWKSAVEKRVCRFEFGGFEEIVSEWRVSLKMSRSRLASLPGEFLSERGNPGIGISSKKLSKLFLFQIFVFLGYC